VWYFAARSAIARRFSVERDEKTFGAQAANHR
jgi:hypothetical protein